MKKLLLSAILLIALNGMAQNAYYTPPDVKTSLWKDFAYDLENTFKGVGFAYTRPLEWQGNDFLKLGGVAAGTTGIYLFDQDINRELMRGRDNAPQFLLEYGYHAGQPQVNYGITGAVYLTGLFTRNEKLRRTGVLLLSAATATGFVQQLTKTAIGRARPSTGLGKHHFESFNGSPPFSSFPSGHAILTFTTAHVIAKQFKNPWIKAGIYSVGVIPGISRIYDNAHWASDVFLSWAMSYFMVNAIDRYLDRKYSEKYNDSSTRSTSFNLTFGGNGVGMVFTF